MLYCKVEICFVGFCVLGEIGYDVKELVFVRNWVIRSVECIGNFVDIVLGCFIFEKKLFMFFIFIWWILLIRYFIIGLCFNFVCVFCYIFIFDNRLCYMNG